ASHDFFPVIPPRVTHNPRQGTNAPVTLPRLSLYNSQIIFPVPRNELLDRVPLQDERCLGELSVPLRHRGALGAVQVLVARPAERHGQTVLVGELSATVAKNTMVDLGRRSAALITGQH
ncbi:MAG: hypothetical protein IKG04_02590, partial [Exiguobacterium sp.]|nr:hypothetical protein [Exiguobacterium sp.]